MLDVHIDDFYKDCAITLLNLFRNFPNKSNLYVDELSGPAELDEFGLQDRRYRSAFGAMTWLAEEGYIRHSGDFNPDGLDQAVLTEKAFNRLCKNINTEQQVQNIALLMENAVLERSSAKINHACRLFFGQE